MLALVYDPALVSDPVTIAAGLGVPSVVAGVPPRYASKVVLPAAGWGVIRETWAGVDWLPTPTRAELDMLPDPGPNPDDVARAQAAASAAVLDVLRSSPIDLTRLGDDLTFLSYYLASSSVQSLPATTARLDTLLTTLTTYYANPTPTGADAISTLKAEIELSVVVQRVALQVVADLIRYVLQR